EKYQQKQMNLKNGAYVINGQEFGPLRCRCLTAWHRNRPSLRLSLLCESGEQQRHTSERLSSKPSVALCRMHVPLLNRSPKRHKQADAAEADVLLPNSETRESYRDLQGPAL